MGTSPSVVSLLDDLLFGAPVSVARRSALASPAADFTASLNFIDSLASRSVLSLSRRDVARIATAVNWGSLSGRSPQKAVPLSFLLDESLISLSSPPRGDGRFFHPQGVSRPVGTYSRDASDLVDPDPFFPRRKAPSRKVSPVTYPGLPEPTPDFPAVTYPPDWKSRRDRVERVFKEFGRALSFRRPSHVEICLRRRMRRQVLMSAGIFRRHYIKPPIFTQWSRVIC